MSVNKIYESLYNLENGVRLLLYLIGKSSKNLEWMNHFKIGDRNIEIIGNERYKQAAAFGHIGYVDRCPLLYLSIDEIISLMTEEKFWRENLTAIFPESSPKILKSKFEEIRSIRNSVAHFRYVPEQSLKVIEGFSQEHFHNANKFINGAVIPFEKMPGNLTNRKDGWYGEALRMSSDLNGFNIQMSRNRQWVSFNYDYRCRFAPEVDTMTHMAWGAFEGEETKPYPHFICTNLLTFKILFHNKIISKCVAYVVDDAQTWVDGEETSSTLRPSGTKYVRIVVSRKNLRTHGGEFLPALFDAINSAERQSDLLEGDSSAETFLVTIQKISAEWEDGCWVMPDDSLIIKRKGNMPEEYWGDYQCRVHEIPESNFFLSPRFVPWQNTGKLLM